MILCAVTGFLSCAAVSAGARPEPPAVLGGLCVSFVPLLLNWIVSLAWNAHHRQAAEVDTLEKMRELSWRDFEQVVAQVYRETGWTVHENLKGGADGGIDLLLCGNGQRWIVQCKRWRTWLVPVQEVRALLGVVAAEEADGGVFVTCGGYTRDAVLFAEGKNLELVDGPALLKMLQGLEGGDPVPRDEHRPPDPAPAASMAVAAAVPVAPACPRCGTAMVRRTARKGPLAGEDFWGCATFPRCRGTRRIPS